jgi:Cu+-exporting ATPase
MELLDVVAAEDGDVDEALRVIGSLEAASEHPVGRAIAAAAARRGALSAVSDFRNHPGLGVTGTVEGRLVMVGRPSLLRDWGLHLDASLDAARDRAEQQGQTVVAGGWDGAVRALFVVADTPKPTSAEAIQHFRRLGLSPVLLTGDHRTTALAVAASVGIVESGHLDGQRAEHVIAEVLPEDKVAVVQRLQAEGRVVAMVGDGVNDAAALAQADLGIAMGTGTDAAIEASDLTVVSGDLRSAADAVRLSRRTLATIKGNLFWAFAYNVAALPLAAFGYLNPVIAGLAMASSSLFVVTNSLRLRRFRSLVAD